ncbi:MAG: HEAT repeat domain-containing protein [Blastocatellia bacterium]
MVRLQAFYSLLRQEPVNAAEGPFIARRTTARLLRAQAGRAERIKASLIEALARENAYVQNSERRNFQLTEAYTDYYGDLIGAVASLHDTRSLNGLLGAITTGGMATDGLADLGAPAVEGVASRLQDRDALVREGAARALGKFLQRPQQSAQSRNAEAAAQRGLLKALDDESPFVRAAAVDSAGAIRNDPEVKRKLESMAERDQYRSTAAAGAAFPVRDAIKRTLAASDYWVMRSQGSLVCRVQAGDEALQGVKYMGPYTTRAEARKNLCSYYDDTRSDSAKCWDLYPKDACK